MNIGLGDLKNKSHDQDYSLNRGHMLFEEILRITTCAVWGLILSFCSSDGKPHADREVWVLNQNLRRF
jgi:hypothetical protein